MEPSRIRNPLESPLNNEVHLVSDITLTPHGDKEMSIGNSALIITQVVESVPQGNSTGILSTRPEDREGSLGPESVAPGSETRGLEEVEEGEGKLPEN